MFYGQDLLTLALLFWLLLILHYENISQFIHSVFLQALLVICIWVISRFSYCERCCHEYILFHILHRACVGVSLGYILRNWIAGHKVYDCLTLGGMAHCFPKWLHQFILPTIYVRLSWKLLRIFSQALPLRRFWFSKLGYVDSMKLTLKKLSQEILMTSQACKIILLS